MSLATDRRAVLGLLAALPALPAFARAGPASTTLPVDDPVWTARAYARIEGDISGRPTWEYVDGYIVGVANDDLPRVLTGFRQIKCSRMTDNRDGTFRHDYGGVYMFTDRATGRPLERWTNPYTRREVHPFSYRSGPSSTLVTPRGLGSVTAPPAADRPLFRLDWLTLGNVAMARLNSAFYFPSYLKPDKWPLESPGERMISSHLTTYRVPIDQLLGTRTSVDAEIFINSQSNWLPWMLMGRTPGIVMYHVLGRKVARLQDLPQDALEAANRLYPGYLADPFSFPKVLQHDEYMARRAPVGP